MRIDAHIEEREDPAILMAVLTNSIWDFSGRAAAFAIKINGLDDFNRRCNRRFVIAGQIRLCNTAILAVLPRAGSPWYMRPFWGSFSAASIKSRAFVTLCR